MRKINSSAIFSNEYLYLLLIVFLLSGCTIFYRYGIYKATDDKLNSDMRLYNSTNIINIRLSEDISKLEFHMNSKSLVFKINTIVLIPITVGSLKHTEIENNDNNLRVIIYGINDVKCDDFLVNLQNFKQIFNNLKFYLRKNYITYSSILNVPECIKVEDKNQNCCYNNDIIYTFPIKIKDIGKEGATLIIEYKDIKKEIPFVYKHGWMYQ